MKRTFATALVLAGALALSGPASPAGGQEAARIHLIHGIPDTPVDVEAGGSNVIEGFEFGDTEDLSAMAGQTLTGVRVNAAGTDDVAIDVGDLALPEAGNVTAIAHLDPEGTPKLTVFTNDTAAVAAGEGRLVVRHTAAAPAVDVRAGGEVVFPGLANPDEAQADLPAGTVAADVVPAGATEPVVIGPADLPVTEGSSLIVYAVGSLEGGTLQTLTETVEGIGSGPSAVNTGNSPVADAGGDGGFPVGMAAAGAAAVAAAGSAAVLARRRAGATVRA